MNILRAELTKAVTLRWVWVVVALGTALPPLLAVLNARAVRQALDAGRPGEITDDLAVIGRGELLLAVAAAAALGVLLAGSEYRASPADKGGGRQASTTALAVPRRWPSVAAKAMITAGLAGLMMGGAAAAGLLAADRYMGRWAVPMDAARWGSLRGAVLFAVLTSLQALALTLLARNGLVPMVVLVANSTVVSVGYLLTRVTRWAWYLPDMAGSALLAGRTDTGQLGAVRGGLVMAGWTATALAAATLIDRRRDA